MVQGFVQILLIDNSKPSDFADISFPDLLEITGYLMLYRVDGLRSVGRLFPNLAVIRGHSLFINYALVAFEMTNLHEIGLYSLTDILRGSVRFEKNPLLCYADTIDWDIIAKAGKGEHVIMGNNPRNNCPVCQKNCPARQIKPDKTLCWNQEHCQRICDPKCEDNACDVTGKQCCHPMCVGGCNGTEAHQCTRCRNVMLPGNPPKCKERCPNGTYEYQNYWCVTAEECRQMKKPLLEAHDVKKHYSYKPFNGSCVIECPAGYMDENVAGKASCRKCKGPCLKECAGANVDSIASAQTLRGCTRITGSLEIQIRGGKNIVKELEDNLSTIEEIDGYLKVVRSFPLISLNFLKNLRVIRGLQLDNGKYSLVVLDNQNLQELWEWDTHPAISIYSDQAPGKVFFHFNPKLCLYKIEMLREKTGLHPFTDLEVAPNSNGDKVACNVTELKTRTVMMWPMTALIEWEVFEHYDTRSLLGYVVYFIEAPNQNVTMYDGRDACGGDGWRVEDVTMAATNGSTQAEPAYMVHILTQLKPYTQYAYYVKTYTIATERSGGQSNMTYFTTKPDAPSAPRGLITWSNSSSELVMHWQPPLQKNGNLTHYRIVGREETDEPDFIYKRNYCLEPLVLLPEKEKGVTLPEDEKKAESENELTKLSEKGTCNCADREADQSMREKEVSSSIAFEDALHNRVYVKRINTRRRRDVNEMSIELDQESLESEDGDSSHDYEKNDTHARNDTSEILVPSTDTMYVMRNLRHFTAYKIEIEACRAREVDDNAKTCSTKSIKTQRTLSLESADEIPPASFKLSKSGENNSIVTLFWEEPPQPNGLIVAYQIEYKREDIENIKADVVCITRRKFTEDHNSYVLKGLTAGRYSVMVRATSMAGNGNYTEKKFFSIEEYENNTFWTFFWAILCIMLVLVFFLGVYVYKRKATQRIQNTLITTVNPEYVPAVYVPDEWEMPRENIVIGNSLGNGSFGMVYEGIVMDVGKGKPKVRCAVKTVNSTATDRERVEFLNEASVMKAFNTHHVVRLLGVVSKVQPTLVVMELMVNGDLKRYLRSHRPDTCEDFTKEPPTLKRILQMAIEIADGMAYLAAKKFVHRDLAARNCMVAEDLTVKIGDFGMTRDIYETDYYRKGTKGLLPVRWMAPESLKDGVFTSFSDVWSYGVVLWEMVTLASQPYQGLSNEQILRYVIEGGVMERPENCPDSLYNLMRRTWSYKATKRPTFIDIATMLLPEIDSKAFERVSFYHSQEGIDARNQNNSHFQPADMDLELMTLQDLREEESEAEEDSPLRQDFGDFASFEPTSIKNSLSPRYGIDLYGENSKATLNCHDMNSSKVPLKAGFDDFDGVSAGSLTSSKDTLNLPFVEDSLKSVKSSPFISRKSASRGNISQASIGKSACPQSLGKRSFLDSPKRANHDYKNRSPEMVISGEKKAAVPLHVDFPSIDAIDVDVEKRDATSTAEYANTPETLNNGYIGRTTT
ncbi:hypothetical protein KM043_005580 [Ampulex compressa]|nr:hypothetical protein KM043_005580 [Ampulex compressa]